MELVQPIKDKIQIEKFKNVLFNTTNAYSINADIINNIIDFIKPEYACVIVESDKDLIVCDDKVNVIKELRDNKNVNIILPDSYTKKEIDEKVKDVMKTTETYIFDGGNSLGEIDE